MILVAHPLRLVGVGLCLALLSTPIVAHREKTDVITLTNGDRVTGEIKQLDQGVLQVKTHLMDTIQIEWVGVEAIESQQLFEVETQTGIKYHGNISPSGSGAFAVSGPVFSGPVFTVTLAHDDIVSVYQLGKGARARWTGHVNIGFNVASANAATTLSLDTAVTLRTIKQTSNYTLSSNFSDRDDADKTWRSQLGATHQRTIKGNIFWSRFAQLENNQELDLKLRATVGAGFGRYFIRNSFSELSLSGGFPCSPRFEGCWTRRRGGQ